MKDTNLIFETYKDAYVAVSPDLGYGGGATGGPVWRWRGVDANTGKILLVSWFEYDSEDAAVGGALDFTHTMHAHHWTPDGEGRVVKTAS
jgi:hypothetical protein